MRSAWAGCSSAYCKSRPDPATFGCATGRRVHEPTLHGIKAASSNARRDPAVPKGAEAATSCRPGQLPPERVPGSAAVSHEVVGLIPILDRYVFLSEVAVRSPGPVVAVGAVGRASGFTVGSLIRKPDRSGLPNRQPQPHAAGWRQYIGTGTQYERFCSPAPECSPCRGGRGLKAAPAPTELARSLLRHCPLSIPLLLLSEAALQSRATPRLGQPQNGRGL
jgi:hypothetical protein